LKDIKKINPPPVKWTGSVLVGGMITRGNTKTDNFNALLHLGRRTDQDRITVDAGYLYGREHTNGDGTHETQNNWFTEGKYDYFFNPKLYAYGDVRAERDVIAGLDLRLTPGVGAGYQWFDSPKFKFNTEAGASYLYRSYSKDGTSESVSMRLAYHVNWAINDKVSLIHDLEYFPGLDRIGNYLITTDAGLHVKLSEKIFTDFRIEERYDSQPAPGKTYNDIRYILGVGINF
jgi:putative salt-induced outer membrane protein YdiY